MRASARSPGPKKRRPRVRGDPAAFTSTTPERRRDAARRVIFGSDARCVGPATAPSSGTSALYPPLVAKAAPNYGGFVVFVYIVNDFKQLGIRLGPAAEPRHGKGRSVGGAPATAFPGTWAPVWGRHRSSLMQQLGAAARFGPVGEIIRRPNHAHIKRSGRGRGLQARRRFDEESRRKRGGHDCRIA